MTPLFSEPRRVLLGALGLVLCLASSAHADWVVDLGSVHRIAGGRSLPLGIDSQGNAYLGSFALHGGESGWVASVDPEGEPRWACKTDQSDSRVTALAVDADDRVWVAGIGVEGMGWDGFEPRSDENFLSVFDGDGAVLVHRSLPSALFPLQLAARPEGGVVLVGRREDRDLALDGRRLEAGGDTILTFFDDGARCSGLYELGEGLRVNVLRAFDAGVVRVAGSVDGRSRLGALRFGEDPFDASSFALRFEPGGEAVLEHLGGNDGVVRRGFRTQDSVAGMVVHGYDVTFLETTSIADPVGSGEGVLWEWKTPGGPSGPSRPGAVLRVAQGDRLVAWFHARRDAGEDGAGAWAVLAGPDLFSAREILTLDAKSKAIVRDVAVHGDAVWVTGTFRHRAKFFAGDEHWSLGNANEHAVFLARVSVED